MKWEQERAAVLCLNGWGGRIEEPVMVIGETQRHYRIRALKHTRLAGGYRWIPPGDKALVPKYAIRFAGEEPTR